MQAQLKELVHKRFIADTEYSQLAHFPRYLKAMNIRLEKLRTNTTRDAQLMATALAASEDTLPHVVMGDLNAVPWEEALQRLRHLGGFGDPRIGRGLFMTWHADHPLLRWPLVESRYSSPVPKLVTHSSPRSNQSPLG